MPKAQIIEIERLVFANDAIILSQEIKQTKFQFEKLTEMTEKIGLNIYLENK